MVKVWKDYRKFSDCESFQIVSKFSRISLVTFIKLLAAFEFYVDLTFSRINFFR
jgi:hypothetical protein